MIESSVIISNCKITDSIQSQLNKTEQIKHCQTPGNGLGYLGYHADADRRLKRGERQAFCKMCERYKWKDKRCEIFEEGEDYLDYEEKPDPLYFREPLIE